MSGVPTTVGVASSESVDDFRYGMRMRHQQVERCSRRRGSEKVVRFRDALTDVGSLNKDDALCTGGHIECRSPLPETFGRVCRPSKEDRGTPDAVRGRGLNLSSIDVGHLRIPGRGLVEWQDV